MSFLTSLNKLLRLRVGDICVSITVALACNLTSLLSKLDINASELIRKNNSLYKSLSVDLNDNQADCSLKGLAMVRGRQHCDNTTDVIHNKSHCRSSQSYKNVLDDNSRTVFQGRIFVAPNSQKTEAHQMSRNLLLSRGANADSKPELIIHADDVKCSHGAAVGDLDQEALFYIKSRGIDSLTARSILVHAFVSDLLEGMPEDNVKGFLKRFINLWLGDVKQFKEVA